MELNKTLCNCFKNNWQYDGSIADMLGNVYPLHDRNILPQVLHENNLFLSVRLFTSEGII